MTQETYNIIKCELPKKFLVRAEKGIIKNAVMSYRSGIGSNSLLITFRGLNKGGLDIASFAGHFGIARVRSRQQSRRSIFQITVKKCPSVIASNF